MIGNNALTVKI